MTYSSLSGSSDPLRHARLRRRLRLPLLDRHRPPWRLLPLRPQLPDRAPGMQYRLPRRRLLPPLLPQRRVQRHRRVALQLNPKPRASHALS